MEGTVFDISEGSIHDGPGLRITVFFKGCPLRCRWCHSPEGQSPEPELLRTPNGGERRCGQWYSAEKLAAYLNTLTPMLHTGGITFSGGEPLMQSDFLLKVIERLIPVHTLLDTCGYASSRDFLSVVRNVSQVFFGLKLLDKTSSQFWTGRDCSQVIHNLRLLDTESATPYRLRIPLLRGVTDTPEHLRALSDLCDTLPRLERIDFLPSNPDAGAKYAACGRQFNPGFEMETYSVLPPWFTLAVPFKLLKTTEIE